MEKMEVNLQKIRPHWKISFIAGNKENLIFNIYKSIQEELTNILIILYIHKRTKERTSVEEDFIRI